MAHLLRPIGFSMKYLQKNWLVNESDFPLRLSGAHPVRLLTTMDSAAARYAASRADQGRRSECDRLYDRSVWRSWLDRRAGCDSDFGKPRRKMRISQQNL